MIKSPVLAMTQQINTKALQQTMQDGGPQEGGFSGINNGNH